MPNVIIYTKANCPYCVRAKQLFDSKHVSYRELRVDLDAQLLNEMMAKSGRRTVPQIFIGDHHVGGCDDLYALHQAGNLDSLLNDDEA